MRDDIIVLAAGPSVKEYDLRDLELRGHLIAINGAALYTKPHVAFTMDRLIAEHCYPVWKIQGVPEVWLRKGAMKSVPTGIRTTQFEHDGNCNGTLMTMTPGKLNGSNSGTCAFNLALQRAVMREARRIFLLGFDMTRGNKNSVPYWYPAFEWNKTGGSKEGNLNLWAEEYLDILPQVRKFAVTVYNVNHKSRITAFPVISYDKFRSLT